MSYARLLYLLHAGLSLTQAADLVAVENHGIPASEWANARDVTTRAVEKNVTEARRHLGIEDDAADGGAAGTGEGSA